MVTVHGKSIDEHFEMLTWYATQVKCLRKYQRSRVMTIPNRFDFISLLTSESWNLTHDLSILNVWQTCVVRASIYVIILHLIRHSSHQDFLFQVKSIFILIARTPWCAAHLLRDPRLDSSDWWRFAFSSRFLQIEELVTNRMCRRQKRDQDSERNVQDVRHVA